MSSGSAYLWSPSRGSGQSAFSSLTPDQSPPAGDTEWTGGRTGQVDVQHGECSVYKLMLGDTRWAGCPV